MSRLESKVAFITGAASGIGKEIAFEFAREGANIVIADMNQQGADATAAEIEKSGSKAIGIAVDVTDETQVGAAVQAAVKVFGNIDILISNAGIQIVHPIEEFSYADWKKMLDIHLNGAFLTTRACMKQMIASKKGGSIIYMGSVHSKEASLLKAPYVTAKHGLIGLAKTVAKEGAKHNIRANVICPGFVRTPLVEKQIPDTMAARGLTREQVIKDVLLAAQPTKEFVTVEEIAGLALYLTSDLARSITGAILAIDGGWTAA